MIVVYFCPRSPPSPLCMSLCINEWRPGLHLYQGMVALDSFFCIWFAYMLELYPDPFVNYFRWTVYFDFNKFSLKSFSEAKESISWCPKSPFPSKIQNEKLPQLLHRQEPVCATYLLIIILSMNGACAHYVMVSKFQWKPFWLVTQLYQQNDWSRWQNRVNYDIFAQAPLKSSLNLSFGKFLQSRTHLGND